VVVLNKGGVGGTLGTQQATTMPADGYSILMSTTSTLVVGPLTNDTVKYDPIKSFEHIGMIAETPYVLVVSNKSGVGSVKELIELAKKNPGKLNYGSAGQGSTTHLAALMFLNATGVKMEHIPYSSNADSTKAVMADEVQVLFGSMPAVLAQIKANSIKALAVGTTTRSAEIPDVPTMQQAGVAGYRASLWLGLSAPANTPAAVIARLSKSLNEVVSDPAVAKQLANTGADATIMSQPEFKKLIAAELDIYKKIVDGMKK
jgi:tripartite-type tricarboxylate transporter receptor subunit TctC